MHLFLSSIALAGSPFPYFEQWVSPESWDVAIKLGRKYKLQNINSAELEVMHLKTYNSKVFKYGNKTYGTRWEKKMFLGQDGLHP